MANRDIAGNTGTGWLKAAALIFMFADHAGKMLYGNLTEMRILGRIAFPLYCWCMVVGICNTRNAPRYILRVLIVGLISQPLNMLALNHTWSEPCVFLTLLLGLLALWGIRSQRLGSEVWAPAAALLLAAITKTDYGWRGVLLIILMYMARSSRPALAAVMLSMSLFWGSTSSQIHSLFGFEFSGLYHIPGLDTILPSFLHLQSFMLLALPFLLIRIPRKRDLHLPKWLGYSIYPLHLIVLYVMEIVMGCVKVVPADLIRPILVLFGAG